MESNDKKANFIVVIISVVLICIIAVIMIFLAYETPITPQKIDIKKFKTLDTSDIIEVSKVYEEGNYFKVEGYIKKSFKRYKLYIGVKNDNEVITFFDTKWHGEDNKVLSIIKKDLVKNDGEIYVAYMCDDEKLLINTNRNVGEAYEK